MIADRENWMACSYQKEFQVSWKKPEGGSKIVILKLNDGNFFSLENPVSIAIWEHLMARSVPAAVLEYLTRTFSREEPARLARDLEGFVGDLIQNKLICPCP